MIRFIFTLVFGYAIAAFMFERVSFDLTQTEWLNLWTYINIGIGMAIYYAFIILVFLSAATFVQSRARKRFFQRR